MCRLPVSAAAESRTDAAAGSSGEQNLQSGGSDSRGSTVSAPVRLPVCRLQATNFMEAETFFQQVGFEDGTEEVLCFKLGWGVGGRIALKLKKRKIKIKMCAKERKRLILDKGHKTKSTQIVSHQPLYVC